VYVYLLLHLLLALELFQTSEIQLLLSVLRVISICVDQREGLEWNRVVGRHIFETFNTWFGEIEIAHTLNSECDICGLDLKKPGVCITTDFVRAWICQKCLGVLLKGAVDHSKD